MDLVVADSVIVSDREGRYEWLFDRTNESRCSGSILISQNKSFLDIISFHNVANTPHLFELGGESQVNEIWDDRKLEVVEFLSLKNVESEYKNVWIIWISCYLAFLETLVNPHPTEQYHESRITYLGEITP